MPSKWDIKSNQPLTPHHPDAASCGRTLYGFNIPLGSSNFLIFPINRTAGSTLEYRMHSAFISPSPCSALMLPRLSLVHLYTKGSSLSRTSLFVSRVASETFRCRLPSPKCPYPTTRMPSIGSRALVASTRPYISDNGRLTSYLYTLPAPARLGN